MKGEKKPQPSWSAVRCWDVFIFFHPGSLIFGSLHISVCMAPSSPTPLLSPSRWSRFLRTCPSPTSFSPHYCHPKPQWPGPCCSPAAVRSLRLFVRGVHWSALALTHANRVFLTATLLEESQGVSRSQGSLIHLTWRKPVPFSIVSVKLRGFFYVQVRLWMVNKHGSLSKKMHARAVHVHFINEKASV